MWLVCVLCVCVSGRRLIGRGDVVRGRGRFKMNGDKYLFDLELLSLSGWMGVAHELPPPPG